MSVESSPCCVGIDLGTSNSTAAVFDGRAVSTVRNFLGGTLTPSIVRIDARGTLQVGARASRYLDADPENTQAGFKRLMGADHEISFPASRRTMTPTQLSAEVLKSLRQDVSDQFGVAPERAVLSVPALFELHQTAATSDAARLAGFERVELIQEPIASAIAAGWTVSGHDGPWLVYDLGGGTFDVSLLETQDGLLRVVGHDGDNFLGGRDFDGVLIELVVAELHAQGHAFDMRDPRLRVAMRRLRAAVEDAKIELSRAPQTTVFVQNLEVGGTSIDVDCILTRADYEMRITALVDRSIQICLRLLSAHGLQPDELARLVLVGGPTVTPLLRERVAEALPAPFAQGLDPMTLVSQGAALYAGTLALDARPQAKAAEVDTKKPRAWLQYPTVSSDLSPFVVGKISDPSGRVTRVRIERTDKSWVSESIAPEPDGSFAIMASLQPKQRSAFAVIGECDGDEVVLATLAITQGVAIGEPPLSRSVGVALADDRVMIFFQRGAPLPIRRTFTLSSAEAVSPDSSDHALKVPIVQGEFALARHCRLVGTLEIPASKLPASLPAGSEIELMLELDRGGELKAQARVKRFDVIFDQVAVLVTPRLSIEAMDVALSKLRERVSEISRSAFKDRDRAATERVSAFAARLQEIENAVQGARSGDPDAGEQARRSLSDFDGDLAGMESDLAFPALVERVDETHYRALGWVAEHGDPGERAALASAYRAAKQAIGTRDFEEAERQLTMIVRLGNAAYFREPGAWASALERCASLVGESTDIRRATELVASGREALQEKNQRRLEDAVRALWALAPIDREKQMLGHGSGIRMP